MSDHEENGENLGPRGNGGLNPPANNNDLDQQLHNITRHANITDQMITSLGESMTLHQALMQVPSFDGKNMPLQAFLLDVENGLTIVPDNLRNTYFNGVKSKLKDTARDAIADKTINTMNTLIDALKEYFATKKTYPQYCADIQAIRLKQNESILSYYTRIKKIRANAITALNESFNNVAEVNAMKKMLDGLALESFKRGLPDDLIYGVSVQNPDTLDEAYKIALRLEEDLKGSSHRNSNYLAYAQSESANLDLPRRTRTVSFQDEERRNTIPFRFTREDNNRPSNSYSRSPVRDTTPPRDKRNYPERGNSPYRSRSRSPGSYYPYYPPPGYFPPIPYIPPMPYQYPPPGAYSPPAPYNPPYYQNYPPQDNNQHSPNNNYSNNNSNNYNNRNNYDNNNQRYGNNGYNSYNRNNYGSYSNNSNPQNQQNNSRPTSPAPPKEPLNSNAVRRNDATSNSANPTETRPSSIRFLTVENS
ncbi:homeobox protein 2-like [Microplitis demolitor]|uniref:homeobox protein 2-like n=1 Tax=Microplitis demolitor TaxID=69319 RepID=UPI00235B6E7B|nr:homeobox protein 2-like [Microplitis demolitor]